MKKFNKAYLLILIVTLCGFTNQKKGLKITYLANCGFFYEASRSKVLIDPFGTEYGNFFYLPSNETMSNIVEGKVPFNDVDLLLITHVHGDHFNAKLAEAFLLNNPKAKMICPSQVYMQMKDSCSRFNQIKPQITSLNLAIGGSQKIKSNGVSITALRMQHGSERSLEGLSYSDYTDYEKTENLGYIIHLDNKNIFHQGDGCLKINGKALKNIHCGIEIGHLSFFDWDSTSLNILKKDLHANKVIFMHETRPAKELESDQFKNIAPQLIFFKRELESQSF